VDNASVMPSRRTNSQLALWLLLGASCVACTTDEPTAAPPVTTTLVSTAPDSTVTESATTAPAVTLTRPNAPFAVGIRQLGGGIPASERAHLSRAIGAPVRAWFEHAFLGVDYPTNDFPAAFDSWTRGAREQATLDRDLTTNASLGPELVAVVADQQRARLFVFASEGVTGGATARVRLAMTAEKTNGGEIGYVVSGEVYLTRDKGRWSIFGYDLQRSLAAS